MGIDRDRVDALTQAIRHRQLRVDRELDRLVRSGVPRRSAVFLANRAIDQERRRESREARNAQAAPSALDCALTVDDLPKHGSALPPLTEETAAGLLTRPAAGRYVERRERRWLLGFIPAWRTVVVLQMPGKDGIYYDVVADAGLWV